VTATHTAVYESRTPQEVVGGLFRVRYRDGDPLNNTRENLEVVKVPVADWHDALSGPTGVHIVSEDGGIYLCNLIASEMIGVPIERFLPPFPAANPPPELRAEEP
jgi:hypothetical protein